MTAQQWMDGFSPYLHEQIIQMSLQCYSLMVLLPWKFAPPKNFNSPKCPFFERKFRLSCLRSSDGWCVEI